MERSAPSIRKSPFEPLDLHPRRAARPRLGDACKFDRKLFESATDSVSSFIFLFVGLLFPAALTFTVGRTRVLRCSFLLGRSRGTLRMLVVMRGLRWGL